MKDKEYPQVSIIIPTYNSAKTLRRTLEGIANQRFHNYEVIIQDGGSNDETIEIADEYLKAGLSGQIFSEADRGVYDAMNKGIDNSRGEWLYFLGSDDSFYDKDVLGDIFGGGNVAADIIYGDVYNESLGKRYDGKFDTLKICHEGICHQSIFYRREVFKKFGYYDDKMKVYAHIYKDKVLFTAPAIKWLYLDRVIAFYDGSGLSRYSFDLEYWQRAEKLLNNCFRNKVSKSEIYKALLPYTQWHFSLDTLKVALKILWFSKSPTGLKYWFNHPYQIFRLTIKKIRFKKDR